MARVFKKLLIAWVLGFAAMVGASDGVMLTVTGKIDNANTHDKHAFVFSTEEFSKLHDTTISATTPYHEGKEFTGPLVRDILKRVGLQKNATEVILVGLDGYQVRVPLSDFEKWDVLVAHSLNGQRLTIKTKGPFWVMYPIDKYPDELANSVTATKMVWNLVSIKVR